MSDPFSTPAPVHAKAMDLRIGQTVRMLIGVGNVNLWTVEGTRILGAETRLSLRNAATNGRVTIDLDNREIVRVMA